MDDGELPVSAIRSFGGEADRSSLVGDKGEATATATAQAWSITTEDMEKGSRARRMRGEWVMDARVHRG